MFLSSIRGLKLRDIIALKTVVVEGLLIIYVNENISQCHSIIASMSINCEE